jgi:hypothetical protein
MMYRSPEVTVQPEDEELEHQGMAPQLEDDELEHEGMMRRGHDRNPNALAEWEKIHRDYPEDMWALCQGKKPEKEYRPGGETE